MSSPNQSTPPARTKYENPLVHRYASKEMSAVWSPVAKFGTWRRLWLALARGEKELGLDITDEQIQEMEATLEDINFRRAEELEKKFRHDVMSHVHAWGEQCPKAKSIIHLGATSCYVCDNSELVMLREGMKLLRRRLLKLMDALGRFADKHKGLATLGFTHYQPAQLVTVGKRATLWLQDFLLDFEELDRQIQTLPMRGVKGTTGTQASFLALFDGDRDKVRRLDERVAELMGFSATIPVSGQTYTRKLDFQILSTLSGIAQSAHKMAVDVRLLMNLKEVDEPFEKNQIGSSAMAYKRNPMRSERCCALARYVIGLTATAAQTAAQQWFERSLDDSAIRRINLPEAFLATDVLLRVAENVASGMVVWPKVIGQRVRSELPFMATEEILMACVKAGGCRQDLHERIRTHSIAAAERVKAEGAENDLLSRIAADEAFAAVHGRMEELLDPTLFTGCCEEQTEEFLRDRLGPVLKSPENAADLRAQTLEKMQV
jgi:adenylosuccinate lyase